MSHHRRTIFIYHANCHDGATARVVHEEWTRQLRSEGHTVSDPVYVPATYGSEPDLTMLAATDSVIIADFSYPPDVLSRMCAAVGDVLLLDHHKTAKESLEEWLLSGEAPGNLEATIDLDRSGARLVLDHFFRLDMDGVNTNTAPRPAWLAKLVDYVEDRDLWRFDLPHSREVASVIEATSTNSRQLRDLGEQLHSNGQSVLSAAKGIAQFQKKLVESTVDLARLVWVDGHEVWAAPAPFPIVSKVGEALYFKETERGFSAVWTDLPNGDLKFSLRSHEDGSDVSAVAKKFGGGGHHSAAGFTLAVCPSPMEGAIYAPSMWEES